MSLGFSTESLLYRLTFLSSAESEMQDSPVSMDSLAPWPCHASLRTSDRVTEPVSKRLKLWDVNSVLATRALFWASTHQPQSCPRTFALAAATTLHSSPQSSGLSPSLLSHGVFQSIISSEGASLTTAFDIAHTHTHTITCPHIYTRRCTPPHTRVHACASTPSLFLLHLSRSALDFSIVSPCHIHWVFWFLFPF